MFAITDSLVFQFPSKNQQARSRLQKRLMRQIDAETQPAQMGYRAEYLQFSVYDTVATQFRQECWQCFGMEMCSLKA